jgi:hypothetical protein
MTPVRAEAIKQLHTKAAADPILGIIVAKQFDIPEWFIPALNRLVRHQDGLTETDIERLMHLGSPRGILNFAIKVAMSQICRLTYQPGDTWCLARGRSLRPEMAIVNSFPPNSTQLLSLPTTI